MEEQYKSSCITLRTEQFGNGTAVEVAVDNTVVLPLYDARALFPTEEEAIAAGRRYGREYIDDVPPSIGEESAPEEGRGVMNAPNPASHGRS